MVCIIIYYFFIDTGLLGGTLVISIIIIFSSFLIIYSLFQLIKVGKKYGNIKNIQQFNLLSFSIRKQIRIVILSIFVFFIFAISPGIFIYVNMVSSDNECEIKCIVLDLIKNCNNDTQKVGALLSWFEKNLSEPNFADMNYRALYEKYYFHFSGIKILKNMSNLIFIIYIRYKY